MLRLMGGIMIVSGCFGLGMWYRQQFVERLHVLRVLLGIQEMLMGEIQYGKTTLPECCKRVGDRQPEPYGSALISIYQVVSENTGECFPKVFCETMEKCLKEVPIAREDKEAFLSFAVGESFEDGRMQLRTIERSKELLLLSVEKMEKENAEKCRMAVGLGAMSGLLLVIILL